MINAQLVSSLLAEKFSLSAVATATIIPTASARDQEVANYLADILDSITTSNSFAIESEISLDDISNETVYEDDDEYIEPDDVNSDPDFMDTQNDEDGTLLRRFSLDYMKKSNRIL